MICLFKRYFAAGSGGDAGATEDHATVSAWLIGSLQAGEENKLDPPPYPPPPAGEDPGTGGGAATLRGNSARELT